MIDQLALLFLFSADTCCSKEYSALGCQVLLITLLALRNARRTFQVSLNAKISLHVVPSEPPSSPSFDRILVAFMAQAASLTSVNSVSESLAPVFVRSGVSSGLGSYSSAQQRASRQAPQYHHVNLFLLFSVACRCPRPQSPATTQCLVQYPHTHSHTAARSLT